MLLILKLSYSVRIELMIAQQQTIFKAKPDPVQSVPKRKVMRPTYPTSMPQDAEVVVEQNKLDKVLKASNRILFHAKSVFPFDLFPDEIIIDENKVDIIYGLFVATKEIFSIPHKSINSATSTTGLFFGSVKIEVTGYEGNPDPIKMLKNEDALKARRMINGLVTATRMNIDLSKLNIKELRDKVEEIGRA